MNAPRNVVVRLRPEPNRIREAVAGDPWVNVGVACSRRLDAIDRNRTSRRRRLSRFRRRNLRR
jgi:hypothetical protein